MAPRPAPHLAPLVERVHARLRPGRLLRPPPVVHFYPYVDTRSTVRRQGDVLALRLSDHLADAPEPVLEGVVSILLCRILRVGEARADPAALRAYKDHVNGERLETRRNESRRQRGRKVLDPVGEHRSLLESYLRVSLDMDVVLPSAPRLGWSPTRSRRRFGHWDPAHECIVVSRALDDARVPEFVLDAVVYHEVLHVVHPVQYGRGRRRVHPPAFVADERRFPRWKEADDWLRKIAGRRWKDPPAPARPAAAWGRPS